MAQTPWRDHAVFDCALQHIWVGKLISSCLLAAVVSAELVLFGREPAGGNWRTGRHCFKRGTFGKGLHLLIAISFLRKLTNKRLHTRKKNGHII